MLVVKNKWSYINPLKETFSDSYQLIQKLNFEKNFKSNMYFKFKIFRITKFQRKIPMRRKHLTNFLNYVNIFYIWANEFKFFKNVLKEILNTNLFKFILLLINNTTFLKTSSYPYSLISMFKGTNLRYNKLKNIKNINITSISQPNFNQKQLSTNLSNIMFLGFTSQNLIWLPVKQKIFFFFKNLINLIFFINLVILKEVYKSFIILSLLNLN